MTTICQDMPESRTQKNENMHQQPLVTLVIDVISQLQNEKKNENTIVYAKNNVVTTIIPGDIQTWFTLQKY